MGERFCLDVFSLIFMHKLYDLNPIPTPLGGMSERTRQQCKIQRKGLIRVSGLEIFVLRR